MIRRATILISSLTALLLSATGCWVVTGHGPMVSLEQNVGEFNSIDVSHAFKVHIVKADRCQVTVRVHENLKQYLEVENHGGTLSVGFRHGISVSRANGEVEIRMPALKSIQLSGACDADMDGNWEMQLFQVDLSGASELSGTVEAGEVELKLSGASKVTLDGKAKQVRLRGSGASDFRLRQLTVDELTADLSGASDARANVTGRLNAELSGASSVHYSGQPTLGRIETSGASSVHKSGD